MIGKLYKYDLKKMGKVLVWFYALGIALAGIARIFNIWADIQFVNIIGKIIQGFTYSAIANILINMVIHVLVNFSRGFYKDESYLTHTLPVSKNELYLSKCLAGLTIIVSSILISVLCVFIMFYTKDLFNTLKALITIVVVDLNIGGGTLVLLLVLAILTEITCMLAIGITAIVKANTYNTKRAIKGVVWFFIYYVGSAIINLVVIAVVFLIKGNAKELLATSMSGSSFITILIVAFVNYLIFTLFHYWLGNRIFNKGVNVD